MVCLIILLWLKAYTNNQGLRLSMTTDVSHHKSVSDSVLSASETNRLRKQDLMKS